MLNQSALTFEISKMFSELFLIALTAIVLLIGLALIIKDQILWQKNRILNEWMERINWKECPVLMFCTFDIINHHIPYLKSASNGSRTNSVSLSSHCG